MTTNFINNLQKNNWKDKYQNNGENLEEFFYRIASNAASVEKNKDLRELWTDKYLSILEEFRFTVGGRISANLGTGKKSKTNFNCFINGPVKKAKISYTRTTKNGKSFPCEIETPDTPDNLYNIFLTILEQAKTLASDGGYGTNVSWIRPRGSLIDGIQIEHPGVVAYLDIFDSVSKTIVRGNNDGYKDSLQNNLTEKERSVFKQIKEIAKSPRKGAMLFTLNIDHPDIEEYIKAKRESGRITKANLSVGITDDFMKAVLKDKDWELKFNGTVYKRIKAKKLYDLIMESTWKYNDPGVLFLDNMNKINPIVYLGECDSTNPCGEIGGNPLISTVCLLGSVNLTQFVKRTENSSIFLWEDYIKTIKIAVRLLDSINDLENSILPQYTWVIKNIRQFGMGINGFGSTCMMMGIEYGYNKECLKFAERLAKEKFEHCWDTSSDLSEEKGAFPLFSEEFTQTQFFDKMLKDFPEIQEKIKKNGVRNAKCTTNPPLGNSMILCGNVSNGIEPVLYDKYERTYICNDWPKETDKDNIKEKLIKTKQGKDIVYIGNIDGQKYLYEPHNRGLCKCEVVEDYGVRWRRLNKIPKSDKGYTLSKNLKVEDHIQVMRVFQKWVEQSISKTLLLPANFKLSEMSDYYTDAWKNNLIGVTTYREGTMSSVISQIEEQPDKIIKKDSVKLPKEFINGNTHIIKIEDCKCYMNFSYHPEDVNQFLPIALWIKSNSKKESVVCGRACRDLRDLCLENKIKKKIVDNTVEKCETDFSHDKLARMVSINLRHNIPITDIISVLEDIDGYNITSLLFAVVKFLSKHVKDGTRIDKICENCKSEGLEYQSGCKTCKNCGWGAC